jgi:capsule polysaccharide modification protein KpsS
MSSNSKPLHICFVSNFTKTYVFNAVAKALKEKYGYTVFWIVVNQKYKAYLEETYPKDQILYIHKGLSESGEPELTGEYKLNEIVYNDRFFSQNIDEGLAFVKAAQKPLYDFIKKNEIRYIFGEVTWSHEILISRIVKDKKELDCKFLNPNVVRLPNDRFAFFSDEKEFLELDPSINYSDMDFPLIKLQKQEYIAAFNDLIKKSYSLNVKLARAKRFFTKENIEKNDPSLPYKFSQRFVRGTRQEIFRSTYKLLDRVELKDIEDKDYVFYPLHVQPEASIDVMGRYYNDQFQNIINIWKLLPNNWLLIVKEHSAGIGDRSLSFYKKIAELQNVFMIHEKTNSHELIRKSKAIFTVSGTVGYEAALMEKPAFTFAPMFFNQLQFCHKITLEDFSNSSNLPELIARKNANNDQKMDLKTFSNFIYYHSYEGTWEPLEKIVFTEKNVDLLTHAVTDIISKYESAKK